jgi:NMD protein affecting ribosome stability and mRNA decay
MSEDPSDGFACPRCGTEVTQRFYGPCGACRTELVDGLSGEQREVSGARFEPRMHVTPNAVATKD